MAAIFERKGSSVRQEAAQRSDGQWFERVQSRGPFGYRWSAWHKVGVHFADDWMERPYAGKARLPKD